MEEEPDTIMCGCGAEPGNPQATSDDLKKEGWNPDGEFGPQCPECVANEPPAGDALDFVEAVNDLTAQVKKSPKVAAKKRKSRKKRS